MGEDKADIMLPPDFGKFMPKGWEAADDTGNNIKVQGKDRPRAHWDPQSHTWVPATEDSGVSAGSNWTQPHVASGGKIQTQWTSTGDTAIWSGAPNYQWVTPDGKQMVDTNTGQLVPYVKPTGTYGEPLK